MWFTSSSWPVDIVEPHQVEGGVVDTSGRRLSEVRAPAPAPAAGLGHLAVVGVGRACHRRVGMATALVQVSAPEDLCSSAAPTGFSPLRNLGNARLAVSGSGVALPAGPAPADFVVRTLSSTDSFCLPSALHLGNWMWWASRGSPVLERWGALCCRLTLAVAVHRW